ncbi:MAG: hypothetical protein ACYC8W_07690 [Candidatus Tyrphobacter sp.]
MILTPARLRRPQIDITVAIVFALQHGAKSGWQHNGPTAPSIGSSISAKKFADYSDDLLHVGAAEGLHHRLRHAISVPSYAASVERSAKVNLFAEAMNDYNYVPMADR